MKAIESQGAILRRYRAGSTKLADGCRVGLNELVNVSPKVHELDPKHRAELEAFHEFIHYAQAMHDHRAAERRLAPKPLSKAAEARVRKAEKSILRGAPVSKLHRHTARCRTDAGFPTQVGDIGRNVERYGIRFADPDGRTYIENADGWLSLEHCSVMRIPIWTWRVPAWVKADRKRRAAFLRQQAEEAERRAAVAS